MKGIYKFTNKKNGKSYIGQSNRLEERYKQHTKSHLNKNHASFETHFYRALRKNGLNGFTYKVIVQSDDFTREDLNSLEIHYVEKYNSFTKGYNMNKGGNFTSSKKVLDDKDVLKIKQLLIDNKLSYTAIAQKFNVSTSLISMINSGNIWNSVGPNNVPLRSRKELSIGAGGRNANAKIGDQKAMQLRVQFMTLTLNEVHVLNKDLLSLSGLKKLLYGVTFQHLPVYKKRQKQWFLNGSCIDYPRLEE